MESDKVPAASSGGAAFFDIEKHEFKVPVKKIDDPMTLEAFKKSDACNELLGFIGALSQSVIKSRMSQTPLADVRFCGIH
jgi:hypothetical protein